MARVEIGTFTRSIVLDVARTLGRLAEADLDVAEHPVLSSPAQFDALAQGDLDLAVTSPDNVLLYAGFESHPLGRRLPLTITAALDRGLGLSLWLRPGLDDLAEARLLGVDVPVSGFALAARELLRLHGTDPDRLDMVSLGSTPRRRASLAAGECDVTILGAGNELRAEEDGCRRVATVGELGPYLGAVAVRLTTLPGERARAADALAEILVDTGDEIVQGRHGARVTDAAERLLGLSPDSARRHLDVLRTPETGIVSGGRLERTALETLARLRAARHDPDALAAAVELVQSSAAGRAAGDAPEALASEAAARR